MKLYNIIDEQGRYCGYKATTETGCQETTHTLSYLGAREIHTELGYKAGLEMTKKERQEAEEDNIGTAIARIQLIKMQK